MEIYYKKPILTDIPQMQKLVLPYVLDGTILARSDDEVATNIRSYTAAWVENSIVGYCSLHIHSVSLAEIRSLIIDQNYQGKGIGKQLVKEALQEARSLAIKEVLALTYQKEFFEKLGFIEIEKESIPEHKIWQDCIKCKHFPICNEVAMLIKIS